MTTTVSRFEAGHGSSIPSTVYSCGCLTTKEEYHDGSVHFMVVNHHGKVLLDEELRGE